MRGRGSNSLPKQKPRPRFLSRQEILPGLQVLPEQELRRHKASGISIATLLLLTTLTLLASLAFGACTFEYQKDSAAAAGNIPDFVLNNAVYTVERSGERAMIFRAETIEMYESDKVADLSAVTFHQRNEDEADASSGSCGNVRIYTNSQDAVLSDGIVILSPSEGVRLEAEHLEWDNRRDRLFSDPDQLVRIIYEDGTRVIGRGFSGDFSLNVFEFQEIVEGNLQYE
jgi:LPS export ABC transporter protein LptC